MPGWEIDPAAELWQAKCERATDGERVPLTRRGKVAAALVPITDYEWLDANHPVTEKDDRLLMATGSLESLTVADAEKGKRTVVLCRGQKSAPLAAVVTAKDLKLLEGRSVS